MSNVKSLLAYIAHHPGLTAAEIADGTNLSTDNVLDLLGPEIDRRRIRVELKLATPVVPIRIYFASEQVAQELAAAARAEARSVTYADASGGALCFGFFPDGRMSIEKGSQSVHLTADESARFFRFIGSINVGHISSARYA